MRGMASALLTIPECVTLKKKRKDKDWTQVYLGRQSGIGSNQISSFERGEKVAWPAARVAIAKVFKVKEEVLFPEYYRRAKTLEETRKNKDLGRRQLANLAESTLEDIKAIEKGTRSPTESEKRRLAQIFGTSIDTLFPEFLTG